MAPLLQHFQELTNFRFVNLGRPSLITYKIELYGCPKRNFDKGDISTALKFVTQNGHWKEISIVTSSFENMEITKPTHKMANEANLTVKWFDFVVEMNNKISQSLIQSGSRVIFITVQNNPKFVKTFLCNLFQNGALLEKFVFFTSVDNYFDVRNSKCNVELESNVLENSKILWIGKSNKFTNQTKVALCENEIDRVMEWLDGENIDRNDSTLIVRNGKTIFDSDRLVKNYPTGFEKMVDSAKRVNVYNSVSMSFLKTVTVTATVCFIIKMLLGRLLVRYLKNIQKQSLHGMVKTRILIMVAIFIFDFAVIPLSWQPGPSCIVGVAMVMVASTLLISIIFGTLMTSISKKHVTMINGTTTSKHFDHVAHHQQQKHSNDVKFQLFHPVMSVKKIGALQENHGLMFFLLLLLVNVAILCTWLATSTIHSETKAIGLEKYNPIDDVFVKFHYFYCNYDSAGTWLLIFLAINVIPSLASFYIGFFYLPTHRHLYDEDFYGELNTLVKILMNLIITLSVAFFAISLEDSPITQQMTLAIASLLLGISTLLVWLFKHLKTVALIITKQIDTQSQNNEPHV